MLPSLLAHDIQQHIKQFLITSIEPADGFFHGGHAPLRRERRRLDERTLATNRPALPA